jgi:hypothetical protein
MRAQQFELIYSQSGLLYNILSDAPRLILDKTRERAGPYADGIVGSAQTKRVEKLTKQFATVIYPTLSSQPDYHFGCSSYPNIESTLHAVD